MKMGISIPSLVKKHCGLYSGESGMEGIRVRVYKWAGTDRLSIQWDKTDGRGYAAIGRMEMHYKELYGSIAEVIKDREYLTEAMAEHGWGVIDLRDTNRKRVFDADFW